MDSTAFVPVKYSREVGWQGTLCRVFVVLIVCCWWVGAYVRVYGQHSSATATSTSVCDLTPS